MYAKCGKCGKIMNPGVSCEGEYIWMRKRRLKRVPHNDTGNCHDCNTPPGGLHHPGCDWERCPICGGQLISCDDA